MGQEDGGGTYTLLVALGDRTETEVGALGRVAFPAGGYAYVGSALGRGGFSRLERHREVAAGDRPVRHWHVDYLLGLPEATVDGAVRSPGRDLECAVADAVGATPVEGFGATDCGCGSHLFHDPDRDRLRRAVRAAHRAAEREADRD